MWIMGFFFSYSICVQLPIVTLHILLHAPQGWRPQASDQIMDQLMSTFSLFITVEQQ